MNGGNMKLGRTGGLYLAAAALRLALFAFFPGLPDLLTGRVEISTPVTSFKRCKTAPLRPRDVAPGTDARHSAGGPLPVSSQRLSLRWRRLPPGAAAPAPLLASPQLRDAAHLHLPPLYSGGPPERGRARQDCGL